MKTKTILLSAAAFLFWPPMIWLGYHSDWTLSRNLFDSSEPRYQQAFAKVLDDTPEVPKL
jgi:hypothetical protein